MCLVSGIWHILHVVDHVHGKLLEVASFLVLYFPTCTSRWILAFTSGLRHGTLGGERRSPQSLLCPTPVLACLHIWASTFQLLGKSCVSTVLNIDYEDDGADCAHLFQHRHSAGRAAVSVTGLGPCWLRFSKSFTERYVRCCLDLALLNCMMAYQALLLLPLYRWAD